MISLSMRGPIVGAVSLATIAALPVPSAAAAESAVVFMYHRFGESTLPSTNIAIEQFEAHLKKLEEGNYIVLPVEEIIESLRAGRALPDRTIGLTIDDAYLSAYTEAIPRLRKHGFPVTLFVATDAVDQGHANYMSWEQVREIAAAGVTIGHHTAAHAHMPDRSATANAEDMARSTARFMAHLGFKPKLFAYPYGEASQAIKSSTIEDGFIAGFGQHSGVVHSKSDFFYLPRFALNEKYGGLDRFRLAANALPLPVSDITPADPLLTENPPAFGFTVDASVASIKRLACYGQSNPRLQRLGTHRVEIRFDAPFTSQRARINCTLPGPDGRWRWYGTQFYLKK
jgi:peptidoglycan/xylan/chitin deacetylase (PgdA/CDA1 family)